MTNLTPPQTPAGEFVADTEFNARKLTQLIDGIRDAPSRLRAAVEGLDDAQLDTLYRNWTIRQITHHVADSHIHSYIRFKWAMTEDCPTIKAYEEAVWVTIADAKRGDVGPSLALLDGLHAKWVQVLEFMDEDLFERTFHHPQTDQRVTLWEALNYYPWHTRHHTGQILWLREHHGW